MSDRLNGNVDLAAAPVRLDDDHVSRALRAFVVSEFQAPASAIVGFIDILGEDAERAGLTEYLGDLEKMRGAGRRLSDLIASVLDGRSAGQDLDRGKLRHDLRTPVTAIIGYGELLAEEARDSGHAVILAPLADVFDAARQLLNVIERLAEYTDSPEGKRPSGGGPSVLEQAVEVVRRLAVQPAAIIPDALGTILVVDDTPSLLELVARRLERDGHEVVTATSGAEALRIVSRRPLDLVLLDLMMPGMSGLEVLQRLRSDPATSRLPVIVISALDEIETAVRCIEAGADDYLSKPLEPTLLRARIASSLDRKFLRDREVETLKRLEAEQALSDRLLRNILPGGVVERLNRGESAIADHFDSATILFCDLVGFTSLTSRLTPAATLAFLGDIFSGFDDLASKHGLEKIKTIGDAYMVVGGLPEAKPGHADSVAALALEMGGVVGAASATHSLPLGLRIGVATGPVVAGIIGRQRFFYDVWGDAVNTASRLESTSEPGRIHISAATREALGERFACERRGILDIRGKGAMETFWLNGHA